ncbi:MAG: S8 family serine peptidase, partial [Delftia sp.]|nr:S8 family serine peptidase [Delftia sp.]
GIIGAEANNRTGGCGASWMVRIMALKFLDSSGRGYDADAIALIDYVIATNRAGSSNVRILSNSWGGYGHSPALQAAIERARDAGIVFVAAAGNESFDLDSSGCGHAPAGLSVSNIVTVSATDGRDRLAFFSNYASSLSALGAPGVNIFSCDLNQGHTMKSGTSMACPHVAGILALTAAANPDLDMPGLVDQLLLNVDPVSALDTRTSTR